ncbi:hypothetical protein I4U23_021680 [Adineta vaga]|nr:hypothetical protein I4U23_021680 [Adineta vaga]
MEEVLQNHFSDRTSSKTIHDRFCLQILPKLHHKIQWLDLHTLSMKDVLRAADYPHLHTLGLYEINEQSARNLFTDEILSPGIFKNQITTLIITIEYQDDDDEEMFLSVGNIYSYIFTAFSSSISLRICEASYENRVRLFIDDLFPNIRSSTLRSLNINLQCFDDFLVILDGRFNQLEILDIKLCNVHYPHRTKNEGNLLNLNYFSLDVTLTMCDYYETILPPPLSNENIITRLPKARHSRCHAYSYPSLTKSYDYVTNSFPGGLFSHVRRVVLYDERPFEHELFLRACKSFPFLTQLAVTDEKSQYKNNSNNENLLPVEFTHLNRLIMIDVHDDYIEQFLFDTKIKIIDI